MKVAMVGTGYVGLVTGACFANVGNKVTCVDNNPEIVKKLNSGEIHIFEPGLKKIVDQSVKNGNLNFTTQIKEAVLNSQIIFLAVGTPSNPDGSFNLDYLKAAAKEVGRVLSQAQSSQEHKIIVCKSTVPQGTHKILSKIIDDELCNREESSKVNWSYVANPEFLAEGNAVDDFSKPDRIVIGTDCSFAYAKMKELYHPFNINDDRVEKGTPADAELTKLFSNTALAIRVAMINEFARIADMTPGADMDKIRKMVCMDNRIGKSFMYPSPGYGGSCFPKDVQGLVHRAEEDGYSSLLLKQIHPSNEMHKNYMGERISRLLNERENPHIAVWGLTFKPNTDDMRDAASIPIITHLLNKGAAVSAYDPQDKKARGIFGERVEFVDEKYEAVENADALVLLTEWKEFDVPDYSLLKEKMRGQQLFDLRNRWLPDIANRNGFDYFGVGRNYPLK